MKRYITLFAILLLPVVAFSQDDQYWQNLAPGKDLVKKVMVNGTLTEVGRTSAPLGDGLRSVGSVGSVANSQGALEDSFFTGLGVSASNVACYGLDDLTPDCGSTGGSLSQLGTVPFTTKGFFGRDSVVEIEETGQQLFSTDSFFDPGDVDFTWSIWIKRDTWTAGGDAYFINTSDSATHSDQSFRFITVDSLDSVRFSIVEVGPTVVFFDVNVSNLDPTEWHHFAATFDTTANVFTGYINGQKVGSATANSMRTASSLRFALGTREAAGNNPCGCEMQDFSLVSGTALTDAQIKQVYSRRFTNHQQISGGHIFTTDSFPFSTTTDRVQFYSLDTLNDGSANGATLTTTGGVAAGSADGIFGASGEAAIFDGVDDYFSIPVASELSYHRNLSVGGWVSAEDWTATQALFAKYEDSNPNKAWLVRMTNGYLDFFCYPDGSTAADCSANQKLDLEYLLPFSWHHLAVTLGDDVVTMYLNGEVAAVTPVTDGTILATVSRDVTFGSRFGGQNFFTGRMDEVFVSNRTLSAADIRKLAGSRLTHSGNVSPVFQQWQATWQREDAQLTLPLENGWITDMNSNAIYTDFQTLGPGSTVSIQLK